MPFTSHRCLLRVLTVIVLRLLHPFTAEPQISYTLLVKFRVVSDVQLAKASVLIPKDVDEFNLIVVSAEQPLKA